jgi:hypothetical protein
MFTSEIWETDLDPAVFGTVAMKVHCKWAREMTGFKLGWISNFYPTMTHAWYRSRL